jgi:hypothetical protein
LRTTIYKAGVSVGGLNQSQNDTDRSNFETNYKPNANGLDRTAIRIEDDVDVDVNIDAVSTGGLLSKKFRYDSLTGNQSIANGSYTTVYTYSGTGAVYGVFLENNTDDLEIEFIIDGDKVIDGIGLVDIPVCGSGNSGHGPLPSFIGRVSTKELVIQPPSGIKYSTSVTIKLKASAGGKKLVSGYVSLTKET